MMDDIKEHSIVIVEDMNKEAFIRQIRKNKGLFDISVLGLREFEKKYYFDYTKEAVYYVSKEYGVIPEVAKIYLENLVFIGDVEDEKMHFLKKLYADLDAHGLLIRDSLFHEFIKNKKVVVYDLDYVDKFYEKMFLEVGEVAHVEYLKKERKTTGKKSIYKLGNKEEEVAFVASEIAKLLSSGVELDRIKLAGVGSEYVYTLRRIFSLFHIPLEIENTNTLASSLILKKFASLYSSDMQKTLEELSKYVNSPEEEYVYKHIVDVLNDYYWCDNYMDVLDLIMVDLKNIKAETTLYKHAVRVVDFMTYDVQDDDYIFLINFNQGSFPVNHKDEDYLSDKLKLRLGLSDSIDLNRKEKRHIQAKIESIPHLVVTYSMRGATGELYVSSAYDGRLFNVCIPTIELSYSDAYNREKLIAFKDEFKKYGSTSDVFLRLLSHYDTDEYCSYDNSFKGLDASARDELLENKLVLSYSSMNSYYQCAFRYYLDNILRMNEEDDTFSNSIGTIFHEVLAKCFSEEFDFETSWRIAVDRTDYDYGNMEKFYLGLLKEELSFVIDVLSIQRKLTLLDEALYEQKIEVPITDDVFFKGFIDKILYTCTKEEKVAIVVDYKTGTPAIVLDNAVYGLDMQLLVYAFLVRHFEPLADAEIGGFYLQKILNSTKDREMKRKALKLQGYSNANPRILQFVDQTYESSSLIKAMGMKDGKFSHFAKTFTSKDIDKIISLVEGKIHEAARDIRECLFAINPKEIGGINVGCAFCTYKDICFRKNADIKKLEKITLKDYLGGEDNGLD